MTHSADPPAQNAAQGLALGPPNGEAQDSFSYLLDELLSLVYYDVPQQIHTVARRSHYAHVIRLAHDGRMTEKDGTWKLCSWRRWTAWRWSSAVQARAGASVGRKDDLAVDLIDRDFPRAGQLDPHSRMAAHGGGLDRPDRCAEILHIEPAQQLRRELRVEKIHNQRIPLPANFDRHGWLRDLDEDPAFLGFSPPAGPINLFAKY